MTNSKYENITPSPQVNGHHLNSPTLTLLVGVAALGALLYASFLFNPHNAGNLFAYILVLAAESFIIFQALLALWTILSGGYNPRDFGYYAAKRSMIQTMGRNAAYLNDLPKLPLLLHQKQVEIDVLIPVYGEPFEKVKATMLAARSMIGRHGTFILDDGGSDELRTLAASQGVGYLRRPDNIGAKAGNINHGLAHTSADFFVILDADFVVKPNFLIETLPFFAQPQVAFVQTPQSYGNMHNVISRGAAYMQTVFYRLIQPGKNRFDAAFCVGTNVVMRRSAVDAIGGIYQESKSEDIWTSLRLHERGYSSIFIGDILATGDAPDTIESYMKQQLRWATGGFEILLRHNLLRSKLSLDQKLQYLGTTSYYLLGLAISLLMLLPPLHIFFNISPVNLSIGFGMWLFYYLAFYATQVAVAFYAIEGFRPEAVILAMVSFPVYLKALTNVLRGRDVAWRATGDRTATESPFNFIVPQVLIFTFLLFVTIVGIWKTVYTGTLALSLVWNILNTIIFGAFLALALRETRQGRRSRYAEPIVAATDRPVMVATRKVRA